MEVGIQFCQKSVEGTSLANNAVAHFLDENYNWTFVVNKPVAAAHEKPLEVRSNMSEDVGGGGGLCLVCCDSITAGCCLPIAGVAVG